MSLLAQLPQQIQPFAGTASGELLPVFQGIANVLLGLIGIVAVIFVTLGGVRYITSGDNSQEQEKAKHSIIYAVIGIIMVALAAAIVNFTVGAIQGRSQSQQRNPLQDLPVRQANPRP